jgi:glycosyltransferase involved in cell wall biosynthesis
VFWGRLPRLADVRGKLAESDVLVHPSLHDNFGNVCLEALAAGKPVLCLDWGGPALQVTPECGIKVFPKTPEQTVAELAAAMERLYREPDLRRRMGESGRRRVHEHFSWDQKGDEMMAAYVEAAESRPRP